MNENINLTKILKYCPKGYKLYTPLYGEVEFEGIIYGKFPIVVTDEFRNIYFTEKGLYYNALNAECLLFPSKEQRDWSKFTAPWLEKQGKPNPYSGVSFKYNGHTWGMFARDNGVEILVDGEIKGRIFLDDEPQGKSALEAIKEEKRDLLFQKMKEAGYEWDADKKELKKLVPNRFDPKTLKAFDRVLVRNYKTTKWRCEHFSYFDGDNYNPCIASCCSYTFCIPYNDDTKHLAGTNEEAPECYRYWED